MTTLSIVVPMYNEEAALDGFFGRLQRVLQTVTPSYEIVCVNDGSQDFTLARLRTAASADPRIKIVNLSRNFGKEIALSAGLDHASGDAIIPIDADLQDPPEVIPMMIAKWRAGAKVVLAKRKDRSSDGWLKRVTANGAYWLFSKLTDPKIPQNVGDFRLMDRVVVDAIKQLPERSRFMKGLFAWIGYEPEYVEYDREARSAGETKWNYWKLWNFALDGITSFSSLPLRIWSYLGFGVSLFAMAYLVWTVAKTMIFGLDVPGYASLMSVILFFNGISLIGIGVIGEYLGRIFTEVKARPLYIVAETVGFEAEAQEYPSSDAQRA
ncbi:MAG: glycosyltransferase family 2 protein [Hyphomonadaceae bacterium]|nr:glycosyltransferase family 2 protein [Hyphomonadaceae bacterium]